MRIAYYGACYPTNIGNAFIDYGSIYTIKTAVPDAKVFYASELPRWIFKTNRSDMDRSIDLAELMDVDFVVVSGMTLCNDFIEAEGAILKRMQDRGVKLIFNGCGGAVYTKEEVNNFREFLKNINGSIFISRDERSYNFYKDYCLNSLNGIDCAFFLSDAFSPAPLIAKEYAVYNFDSMKEPKIENSKRVIRTHHSCFTFLQKKRFRRSKLFKERDVLISDIPEDYLNIYANALTIYSDRVHACIAGLSFGRSARLYSHTLRGGVFDRMGIGEIREKLIKLDMDKLDIEKKKQISFLKNIFKRG